MEHEKICFDKKKLEQILNEFSQKINTTIEINGILINYSKIFDNFLQQLNSIVIQEQKNVINEADE